MKAEDWMVLLVVGLLLATGFGVGFLVGVGSQKDDDTRHWQAEIAKRGFGSFIITDSLSGATEFQWRKP